MISILNFFYLFFQNNQYQTIIGRHCVQYLTRLGVSNIGGVSQAYKSKLVESPVSLVSHLYCPSLPPVCDLILRITIYTRRPYTEEEGGENDDDDDDVPFTMDLYFSLMTFSSKEHIFV